ncbi:MAG: hypothetical protein NFCOHLIN_02837 [Gammaproteobacteria bacterium]|nr:hypothetical protein [Gammaproteobacteria bacterium]
MQRFAHRQRHAGFTLIELAVVLLIVTILIALGIGAFSTAIRARHYTTTAVRIESIRDALSNYLRTHHHLPCPDRDFNAPDGEGEEHRVTPGDAATACPPQNFGIVPFRDLGINRDDALDGWDNFFSYKVSNVNLSVPPPRTNKNWTVYSTNDAVNEMWVGNDGALSDTGGALGSGVTNAVVVIISHGPNGYGAYTTAGTRNVLPTAADAALTDEQVNTTVGLNFVDRPATDVPPAGGGGTFDDVVSRMLPLDLLAPLIKDGSRKSADGLLEELFAQERSVIVGQILAGVDYASGLCSDGTAPPCTPPARQENTYDLPPSGLLQARDPWGMRLEYIQDTGNIALTDPSPPPPPPVNAFRIRSFGPDRMQGNADDKVTIMTVDELRGILGKTGF